MSCLESEYCTREIIDSWVEKIEPVSCVETIEPEREASCIMKAV